MILYKNEKLGGDIEILMNLKTNYSIVITIYCSV